MEVLRRVDLGEHESMDAWEAQLLRLAMNNDLLLLHKADAACYAPLG